MPLKSPLEEYHEFLATCPGWVKWMLGIESFQPEYGDQWARSDPAQVVAFENRFFELLAHLPKERKRWERRTGRILSRGRILVKKGRPRQDMKAQEIDRLRRKKKTYGEIAVAIKRPDEKEPPTADSVRKLHRSRKGKSSGEKSD